MKPLKLFALLLFCFLDTVAQTGNYKVYALRFARSGYPFTAADWAAGGSKTERLDISFSVWLIKGRGKTILVDAGFLKDSEDAKEFQLTEYLRPDSVLLQMGIKADDITDIIISHPHWDHLDGVSLFPKAHVWIQKEDYNYFVGRAWQEPKDAGGFAKRDVLKLVDLNLSGRLTLVNGDNKEILRGIRVYTGSRHTYNSQYVVINSGSKHTVLASDNVWIYANLRQMIPAVKAGTFDAAGYVRAMKRMKSLASAPNLIIPGHDGQVYQRFHSISKDIVEIK